MCAHFWGGHVVIALTRVNGNDSIGHSNSKPLPNSVLNRFSNSGPNREEHATTHRTTKTTSFVGACLDQTKACGCRELWRIVADGVGGSLLSFVVLREHPLLALRPPACRAVRFEDFAERWDESASSGTTLGHNLVSNVSTNVMTNVPPGASIVTTKSFGARRGWRKGGSPWS